jgi:phosphoheptose isomerase
MTARTLIRERLQAGIALRAQLEDACGTPIVAAAERIVAAYRAGNKLLLCGNGGSAATASTWPPSSCRSSAT